ncbi:hypothetical protein, partial [Sphingomonas sp. RB1R13]|uniref:hypothetical protein n=1 Tax=Sphingomonas sp. RB1R13 TaxID=3096159 RepID=UPI002FC7AB26
MPFEVGADDETTVQRFVDAAIQTLRSCDGKPSGLMLQRYMRPASQGEFGNLQHVSKTRDQWEIATREVGGITSRARLNSQRDSAADPELPLAVRAGLARERLFGSVGAWLNNELLLGRSQRLSCEWISDNRQFYIVQIDEEDEDLAGVNPFQVRVPATVRPETKGGRYLKPAEPSVLKDWDKLEVLEQLWEADALQKPTLFYLPISDLPAHPDEADQASLTTDFEKLLGPKGIVVRTSVRAKA